MEESFLPKSIKQIVVPPLKCQGIKTKLINFIAQNIKWDGTGTWYEPFLGSGVVLFNIQPQRAIIGDINPHIIRLYREIYDGTLSPDEVKKFLTAEGAQLLKRGENYYYEVRERFNKYWNILDFIFLNRACYNGMIRFNKNGDFNVPFCRKTDRFRQSYVTKITNQISRVKEIMQGKDWVFYVGDWRQAFTNIQSNDFFYLDPPYIGRNTDYYQQWKVQDVIDLFNTIYNLPCGFAMSMWKENMYRLNPCIQSLNTELLIEKNFLHFYHIGSTLKHRNYMIEALLIKREYAVIDTNDILKEEPPN